MPANGVGEARLLSRRLPILLALVGLACALGFPAAARANRPNVLFVLLDNTGWADFGPYGGGALRGAPSPNVDRLAAEGVTLQNFNTEAQCTPSRSALMTGRFAVRSGTQSVPIGVPYYGLVPWEETLAELLSERGYATGIFGKWHLGKTPGRFPTDQGFDVWYGIANSTDESLWTSREAIAPFTNAEEATAALPERERPFVLEARRGEAPKRVGPWNAERRRTLDGDLVEKAIRFMRESKRSGRPFFAYVPLTAMHFPTWPHPDFEGRTGAGMYADLLVQTDAYLGQLLEALASLDLEEDTLVVFTADNGVEDPVNGDGNFTGWTGPWSGTYFTALEGGLRVPFVARWPGRIEAGRVTNGIAHLVDLMPTIAAWTGARIPTDRPIDGLDLGDFLTGETEASPREGFPIYVGNDLYAIKWHDWKAHYIWQPTKYAPQQRFSTVPRIVNLLRDPGETRQVAEPYNAWLQYGAMPLLLGFHASAAKFPHVPVGAPDAYRPPTQGSDRP